jgi:hypothetical protein
MGDTSFTSGLVHNNSPLNLLAKFTHLFRVRFSQGGTPWEYKANAADSGIYIDTEYSTEVPYRNQSPAVIVARGSIVQSRPVLADRDQHTVDELRTGGKYSYGMSDADMRIECIGQTYGESAIIADVVQTTVMMTLREITKAFTLRDISPVVMSPTNPYVRDETKFMTTVDFRVSFEQRWFSIEAAPLLQKAFLHIAEVIADSALPVVAPEAQGSTSVSVGGSPPVYAETLPPVGFLNSLVFLNSPLHLIGKFSDFLRARFMQPGLPWQYSANAADSSIFVLPEYNMPSGVTNISPAVIVSRGSVIHSRIVLGDTGVDSPGLLNRSFENSYGLGEADIRLECIGQTYGESSILADVVQSSISMSRTVLTKAFTLRDISTVVLGPTQPHQRDETKFITTVDFRIFFENRWFVAPIAPVLRGASLFLREADTEPVPGGILSNTPCDTPVVQSQGFYVPSGGLAGQVLTKLSGMDYDVGWVTNLSGGGGGGATGFTIENEATYNATHVYVGYTSTIDASWYIYRRNLTSNVREYATGVDFYAASWASRTSLIYGPWS